MLTRHLIATALCCALFSASASAKEELLQVATKRDDTKIATLLTYEPSKKPSAIAFLVPGGLGDYFFKQEDDGKISMINSERLPNRLRPLLLERGVASIMIDRASDRPRPGRGDSSSPRHIQEEAAYRASSTHMSDLKVVLETARARFPGVPVVLIGHSYGSFSAAHGGANLEGLAGTIIMAGAHLRHPHLGDQLSQFDWGRIQSPIYLIHHAKDDCTATPYKGSVDLNTRLPKIKLLSLGEDASGKAGCTYESSHNFLGDEAAVADAIAKWISSL